MQNPLRKSCSFQPGNALGVGSLGCMHVGMVKIELGFVMEDLLIKISIPHNFGVKPPVANTFDHFLEDVVMSSCPLKGFREPVWENFWQVSRAVTRLSIYLYDIREVPFSIAFSISSDLAIVKLFDPLGRDTMTLSDRDGK